MFGQWIKKAFITPNISQTHRIPFSTKPLNNRNAFKYVSNTATTHSLNNPPVIKSTSISPYKVATFAADVDSALISSAQWGHYSHLPQISICPEGFSREIWNFYCVGAALIDSWKVGMPHEYSTILAQSLFIPRGVGVRLTQQMLAHTDFFSKVVPGLHGDKIVTENIILNWLKILPPEVLLRFPDYFKGTLSRISAKTQPTLGYEFWAISKVNADLQHIRLGFAFDMDSIMWEEDFRFKPQDPFPYEKHFSKESTNYINQTQNKHPDYVLVLESPVTVKSLPEKNNITGIMVEGETHPRNLVAFDLKFGPCSPSRNLVKACENDNQLVESLRAVQQSLIEYLENNIYRYQVEEAKIIISSLKQNVYNYNQTQNVTSFQSVYHQIYDQNVNFFLKNNIGFNFIVNLPIRELAIPEAHVSFFSNRFRAHYTRPGVVSHFATQIAKENPATISANSHIAQFIKDYLTTRQ